VALEEAGDLRKHAAMVHRGWIRTSRQRPRKTADTLRARALHAIALTQWVPPVGAERINGMIVQQAGLGDLAPAPWGVPIAVFVRKKGDGSAEILPGRRPVNKRIADAFEQEGADDWYMDGARERFLGSRATRKWVKVERHLDVWFDSGSTHAFVLEDPVHFSGSRRHQRASSMRRRHGCIWRALRPAPWLVPVIAAGKLRHPSRAPFDSCSPRLHAGREGPQMSKSIGNTVERQKVIGAIRRRYIAAVGLRYDYADDQRNSPEILRTHRDLPQAAQLDPLDARHAASFQAGREVAHAEMPELERLMLNELAEQAAKFVRKAYAEFRYKTVVAVSRRS